MPLTLFTIDEFAILTALSGFEPDKLSPIHMAQSRMVELDDKEIIKITRRLSRDKFILGLKKGGYDIHPILAIVFKVLCNPEEVILLSILSMLDSPNTFYLRTSNTWVLYKPVDGYNSILLGYPLSKNDVIESILNEFRDRVEEGLEEGGIYYSIDTEEYLVLTAIQRLFHKRLKRAGKSPRFKVLDILEVFRSGDISDTPLVAYMDEIRNTVNRMLEDEDLIYDALDRLIEKEVLNVYKDGEEVGYTREIAPYMDPRGMVESIVIRRIIAKDNVYKDLSLSIHRDRILTIMPYKGSLIIRGGGLEDMLNNVIESFLR